MKIDKDVKIIRELLDISQQELAEDIGTSYEVINRWENANVIPEDNFFATVAELRNFIDCVKMGILPDPDVHNGANMTFMVEAARTSSFI